MAECEHCVANLMKGLPKSAKTLSEINAEFSPCSTAAVWPYLMIARACADKLLLASRLSGKG
jgi:hypothetical protein